MNSREAEANRRNREDDTFMDNRSIKFKWPCYECPLQLSPLFIRRYIEDAGNTLQEEDPMNNNDPENNDGNDGSAPAPAAPGKQYEDMATQTEDEDECGEDDSYCSYNEYSEFKLKC